MILASFFPLYGTYLIERKKGLMLGYSLLRWLAPPACRGCDRPGVELCLSCLKSCPVAQYVCPGCGWGTSHGQACIGCWRRVRLVGAAVALEYDGLARRLLLGVKRRADYGAAGILGALLARRVLMSDCLPEVVTWVPSPPGRYRRRGHNPAELIAKATARQLGLPYRPLLGRLRSTHQIGLGRQERLQQIQGSFFAPLPVASACYLVVDDVITTGATLNEVAAVLLQAGAREVWGAAAVRRR